MPDREDIYSSVHHRFCPTPEGRILWDVLEEHLDEGGFELARITRAQDSPAYKLDEVADNLEPQLLTHVGAVRLTGRSGFERLVAPILARLDDEDVDTVSFAAFVALSDGHVESLQPAIWEGSESIFHAVLRAVELHPGRDTDIWIRKLVDMTAPSTRAKRVRALRLAAARHLPVESLRASLQSDDEHEVRAAASLLRWMPGEPSVGLAQYAATAGPASVRLAAAIALLQWRSATGLQVCHALLSEDEGSNAAAMEAIALFGGKKDHARLIEAVTEDTCAHSAIRAVGFSGNVAAVDSLIRIMRVDDKRTSRLAAEAFFLITGFDIWDDRHRLQPQPDSDAEARDARQSPADESDQIEDTLAPTPIDALPIVDPNAARQFWDERCGSFSSNARYLTGDPDLGRALLWGLRYGRMRDRHALATSLAVRSSGRCAVNPRWLARTQRMRLTELALSPGSHLDNPVADW